MRLCFPLIPHSHIAQAIASGRCSFYQGIVPICFSLGRAGFQTASPTPAHASRSTPKGTPELPVTGLRSPVVIVFDYSSRPFINKTPKSRPEIEKTIKQFVRDTLRDTIKKCRKFRNNCRRLLPYGIGKSQPSGSCQAATSTALPAKRILSACCQTSAFLPPSDRGGACAAVILTFVPGILKTPKIRAHPLNPSPPRSIPCHQLAAVALPAFSPPAIRFPRFRKNLRFIHEQPLAPSASSLLSIAKHPRGTVHRQLTTVPGEGLRQY
jgi:hypothetical protein